MNKNVIIAIVAVIVIGGGGAAAYFYTQNDNTASSDTNTTATDKRPSVFEPKQTTDRDFKATLTTEGETVKTSFEYDTDEKVFHYESNVDGQTFESITTEDAQYMYTNDKWLKYPVGQQQSTNFDPEEYQFDDEELRDYQSNVEYKGTESCSVGRCHVWKADTPESESTFYVSTKDGYIVKVETVVDGKISTITYEYEDVEIEVPTDAQELPSFESSL